MHQVPAHQEMAIASSKQRSSLTHGVTLNCSRPGVMLRMCITQAEPCQHHHEWLQEGAVTAKSTPAYTKAALTLAPRSCPESGLLMHTWLDQQQALGCATGTVLPPLQQTWRSSEQAEQQSPLHKPSAAALWKCQGAARGGQRRVVLQQCSEEEFVKFPEGDFGDLGQRKMLRLCKCSSWVSQESLALHPKFFWLLISLSLSPTRQPSQKVILLSKATTHHKHFCSLMPTLCARKADRTCPSHSSF